MQNLQEELIKILICDDRFVIEGQLSKNKIVEFGLKLDGTLLKLLLKSDVIKKHFFENVGGVFVFDKIKFQKLISNKAFLPDTFTAYKDKIGLISTNLEGSYDSFLTESNEVVLAFPHKDTILEDGQTKEDRQARTEIFWSETLAPDDVEKLKEPKVLTNFKRYTKDGVKPVTAISQKDNLVIKGNNLFTLYSLEKIYTEQIKLIYIDPPYNTGNNSFAYNDAFTHSTWLTFMKNRLEIAQKLLTKDGSIWLNIDDDESHYLKVLCDEIFGRQNFVNNIVWEKKYTVSNDAKYFSDNHDHILVYAKNKDLWKLNKLARTEKMNKAYSNPDNHPKGVWKATPLQARSGTDTNFVHTFPNGISWSPPQGRFSAYSHHTLDDMYQKNEIWFGKNGTAIPSRKTFLTELKSDGLIARTLWRFDEVGHNHEAKQEIKLLFDKNIFNTPKPERLLNRIIDLATDENDIVLDFFGGSATTAAVALKTNRRSITCEQMDFIEEITVERLKKVIAGEQGGISQDVRWQGGGEFVYFELKEYSYPFIKDIEGAKTDAELVDIWQKIQEKTALKVKVDASKMTKSKQEFETLSVDVKKNILLSILDKNLLYVPFNERNNEDFKVSKLEEAQSEMFYNLDLNH
jgi:adenine-specific DNA-methyltransferase